MKTISLLFIISLFINGVFGDEVKMSVMEGDSVTLQTGLTDMRGVMRIIWRVGEKDSKSLLVGIYGNRTIDVNYTDVRFRDRLQVNHQTGDLNINNMRVKHCELYQAEININNTGTTNKTFNITVSKSPNLLYTCDVKSKSVMKGDSVTLHTDVQTQNDTLILWRFGDEGLLIAKYDKEDNKSPIYEDEGFRDRLKLDDQNGDLTIRNITSDLSGPYKLKISSNNQTLCKKFYVYVSVITAAPALPVEYVVLLVLVLLVLMAIFVNQCRLNIPCQSSIKLKPFVKGHYSSGDPALPEASPSAPSCVLKE